MAEETSSRSDNTQTAIATKKRLYAKALDSLTSHSRTSLANSTSGTSTKRPASAVEAFDEARARASKRLRQSTSSSSLVSAGVPTIAKAARRDPSTSKPLPNYAPWSHEAFLARLKSFSSVSLWHPKPEPINEVAWAKRGWSCADVNTVRCNGGCEIRLVVDLQSLPASNFADREDEDEDPREDEDDDNDHDDAETAFEIALSARYQDLIVNGHADSCLWRKAGCKDDIYHLQVVRPLSWQPELQKRFAANLEVGDSIQHAKFASRVEPDPKVSAPERLLTDLPPGVLSEDGTAFDNENAAKALDIALHGWTGLREAGMDLLQCGACFQRIGLWMYQPGYTSALYHSDDQDESDDLTIDLVQLHREHCPWRNAESQKASGSLSGLNASEVLQRVVTTYVREHRRRSNEMAPATTAELEPGGDTELPIYSREEIARQDKERESRLRKLKSLFSIKRRATKTMAKTTVS